MARSPSSFLYHQNLVSRSVALPYSQYVCSCTITSGDFYSLPREWLCCTVDTADLKRPKQPNRSKYPFRPARHTASKPCRKACRNATRNAWFPSLDPFGGSISYPQAISISALRLSSFLRIYLLLRLENLAQSQWHGFRLHITSWSLLLEDIPNHLKPPKHLDKLFKS